MYYCVALEIDKECWTLSTKDMPIGVDDIWLQPSQGERANFKARYAMEIGRLVLLRTMTQSRLRGIHQPLPLYIPLPLEID